MSYMNVLITSGVYPYIVKNSKRKNLKIQKRKIVYIKMKDQIKKSSCTAEQKAKLLMYLRLLR